ncbi:hypothetical protein Pint_33483 [Pistacia integerrima]|uniref:Uncharacterized protein n=1 Tax=Pistacia integerrima TaxID=434235 RepID=A0ACC0X815_9ROSI|nr:hypothetical protein Pint_33483 [Pistacia integerrima]
MEAKNFLKVANPRLSEDFDEQRMKVLMIVGRGVLTLMKISEPSIRRAIHVLNSKLHCGSSTKDAVPTYLAPSGNMAISSIDFVWDHLFEGGQNLNQSSSLITTQIPHS